MSEQKVIDISHYLCRVSEERMDKVYLLIEEGGVDIGCIVGEVGDCWYYLSDAWHPTYKDCLEDVLEHYKYLFDYNSCQAVLLKGQIYEKEVDTD